MTKIQKNFIISVMQSEMKKYIDLFPEDNFPKLLAQYIQTRFKCTKHIAKEITKTLIDDRTRLN
tara:strand:+ start:471 stop:662 length:192 start_codon:yes stop_codon:yes gene_type:complete